jgi:hypothetical protein
MTLPEGLQFLHFGWWAVHAIAFLLVYQYGYARGRGDERRERRQREVAGHREPAERAR